MSTVVLNSEGSPVVIQEETVTIVSYTDIPTYVVTGIQGPPGPSGAVNATISNLNDVDVSTLLDGSVLVYSSSANRWQATTTLEKQYFNGGFF